MCVYVKVIVMVQIALSTNKKLTQLDVFKQKKKRKKKVIKSREVEEKNHYKPSPVPPSCGCSIWESPWKGSRSGWASAPGWLWGSLWAASPRAGAGKALPCCGTALPGHLGNRVCSCCGSLGQGLVESWVLGRQSWHYPPPCLPPPCCQHCQPDPIPGRQRSFVLDLAPESPV